ncbi:hypothetical protein BDV10DRAFT_189917 [Aspergillus recurvatus]
MCRQQEKLVLIEEKRHMGFWLNAREGPPRGGFSWRNSVQHSLFVSPTSKSSRGQETMYHGAPQKSSSYFMGGIDAFPLHSHSHSHSHPALNLGEETRLGMHGQCQWASPQFAEQNLQFLSAMSPSIHTPATVNDDIFSFPSTSTESSPHMSHLTVSDRKSTSNDIDFADTGEQHHKTTLRRSQNRQAQRRFRERKEAQKSELLSRLDELQSKHDAMANKLESLRQRNTTLDSDKRRLEREVETLRKWRERILVVMADIVRKDSGIGGNGRTDESLKRVESSCSVGCWRRGVEYERSCIVMQTLLELFGEGQDSDGAGSCALERCRGDSGDEGQDTRKLKGRA